MNMRYTFFAVLGLILFLNGICEAQQPDQGHIINFGDGGKTPDPSIPEPSITSLVLFGATALLAFRKLS